MIERWAMIRDGIVENVCNWDGLTTTWQPPDGVQMQQAPDHVGIGWTYDGVDWTAPPEPTQ
jgi:hypothetical protein